MVSRLGRYLQIIRAISALFLGYWIRKAYYGVLRFFGRQTVQISPLPYELRVTLERLGVTFVKFGQLMAMRPDIFPPEYIAELSKLLDDVEPFDSNVAMEIVRNEFGQSVDELFQSFDVEPIAAASFAQVHRAVLHSGQVVAVKIQRPQARVLVKDDIRLVRFFSTLAKWSGVFKRIKISDLIDEFELWTNEELDYTLEATYAERLRQNSLSSDDFYIPEICWEFTSSRVLTLEFLEGTWIRDILSALDAGDDEYLSTISDEGIDLKQVAYNLFFSGMKQVFEDGIFHADPHAGNLVILENNVVGYIDFGIVGQIDEQFRSIQLSILRALESNDLDQYFRSLLQLMSPPPENLDLDIVKLAIKKNARDWTNAFYNPKSSLADRSTAQLFIANLATAREFGLTFSEVAVRYYRALGVSELILLQLNPAFDTRSNIKRFLTKLELRRFLSDTTPQATVATMIRFRDIFQRVSTSPELANELRAYFDDEITSLRSSVSNFRVFLSQFFKRLAQFGVLGIPIIILAHLFFPDAFPGIVPIDWRQGVLVLVLIVPFFAWLSRMFYITSVRTGSVVRR